MLTDTNRHEQTLTVNASYGTCCKYVDEVRHAHCTVCCDFLVFIPKLLLRLLWFFRRTAALFRQIRTFPQLFRFCSDLGNSGIWVYLTNREICNTYVERCGLFLHVQKEECVLVIRARCVQHQPKTGCVG